MVGVRADEHLSDVAPRAELDAFAVKQPQPTIRGQRAVADDEVEHGAFPGAGFTPGEQVAIGQGDRDRHAVFVGAQMDRVIDRQGTHRHRDLHNLAAQVW